ncbi:MAG: carbamoyl phosphate synthase preATP-grasp domain-containing protein, partial [Thermoplasmataceae archaeon]
ASLEERYQFGCDLNLNDEELIWYLKNPTHLRLRAIFEAFMRGFNSSEIKLHTAWDIDILMRIESVISALKDLRNDHGNLKFLKGIGVPDFIISEMTEKSEIDVLKEREKNLFYPTMRMIDTSSNEFESSSGYFYSTYMESNDAEPLDSGNSVLIIGSGPNRISQGLEYDYGSVKSLLYMKKKGISTIMINSNPETVSTDFDVSGRLYFEPLKLEYVANIIRFEKPKGIIIQFSGQTGQNMAREISSIFGEEIILGTSSESIQKIEERIAFSKILDEIGLPQTEYAYIENLLDLEERIKELGLPVIIRTSFIIGGNSVRVIRTQSELISVVKEYRKQSVNGMILINRFLDNYDEIDVDFISNGKDFRISGISMHVEEAGIHSGDAVSITGPGILDNSALEKIKLILSKLNQIYNLKGFSNLQVAIKGEDIRIIELNSRLSRSFSFICKATGINWIEYGINAILSGTLPDIQWNPVTYSAKIPVFPFNIFNQEDIKLGPEMKSTGETMVSGKTLQELWSKIGLHYGIKPGFRRDVVVFDNGETLFEVNQNHKWISTIRIFNQENLDNMVTYLNLLEKPFFVDLYETYSESLEILKRMLFRKGSTIIVNKRLFLKLLSVESVPVVVREINEYS